MQGDLELQKRALELMMRGKTQAEISSAHKLDLAILSSIRKRFIPEKMGKKSLSFKYSDAQIHEKLAEFTKPVANRYKTKHKRASLRSTRRAPTSPAKTQGGRTISVQDLTARIVKIRAEAESRVTALQGLIDELPH